MGLGCARGQRSLNERCRSKVSTPSNGGGQFVVRGRTLKPISIPVDRSARIATRAGGLRRGVVALRMRGSGLAMARENLNPT